jgi:hypothetical protein
MHHIAAEFVSRLLTIDQKQRRVNVCLELREKANEDPTLLDSIKENDFHGALEASKKRWNRCILSQGDYLKEMAAKIELSQHFFFYLVRELSDKPRMLAFV